MLRFMNGKVGAVLAAGVLPVAITLPAKADVDIHFVPTHNSVLVGEEVGIQVILMASGAELEIVSAAQVIFQWDPQKLHLVALSNAGAVDLLFSNFGNDPYGINESIPPQDGTGLYQAWANLGGNLAVTGEGTLLTTLIFEALEPAAPTPIDILLSAGSPIGFTRVFDGVIPNHDITGSLFGAEVVIELECPADLNGDGNVGVPDVLELLALWGQCDDGEGCQADLNGDDSIGVPDLLLLLSAWGPCI